MSADPSAASRSKGSSARSPTRSSAAAITWVLCRSDRRPHRCRARHLLSRSPKVAPTRAAAGVVLPIPMSPMINKSAPAAISTGDRLAGAQRRPAVVGCQGVGLVDRLGGTEVVRRNLGRYVLKIIIDTQIEYPQRHVVLPSKAVSAGDARDEGTHHHRRDLPRIGGDAIVRDAMITSQDHRPHPVQGARWAGRLAGRHPRGQILKRPSAPSGFASASRRRRASAYTSDEGG